MRTDRHIRVFISSTFRDMKQERDHLVKFTFPQLRKLCESRGVTWGEVDLRWGVTDEQKAEGKVLPICLEEIKRCRPYFIGLLGERYGWIPDTIAPETIEREPWLREHVHGRKSVTELEILHGVLNNPDMAEHAFFYFRDPKYVESLPPETRKDFTAESAEDAIRLSDLKNRIRNSGFPVQENYPEPKALGDLVLADLTAVIDKIFPKGSQPDPLDHEAMDHEAYAQSRERVYIGRPEYFAKLDAHADCSGDQPLVILGESGCGKSALLANWVSRYRQKHPEVLILQHYIGATPYSADWAAMLRRVMGEFKRHLGIQQDIPDKPDALRSSFANWLHMAAAKGRVVLILDALNQLEDRDGAPDLVWLPPVMPENVRLIVSTLPGRPLDEIKKRRWPSLEVELLDQAERERLIGEYLAQHAKVLSPDRMESIAAAPQSANPLYLRVLLDELRLFGDYERLNECIGHYMEAVDIPQLYERVLTRYEQDYDRDRKRLVKDTMTSIWASRRGLLERELLEILGSEENPLPALYWSPLSIAVGCSLVNRSGLISFSHEYFRQAVYHKFIRTKEEATAAHLQIADYFAHRQHGIRRIIDEMPWQLAEAKEWKRLARFLSHPKLLSAIFKSSRCEAKRYWRLIEKNTYLKIPDIYSSVIQEPERFLDGSLIVSDLLDETSYPDEAIRLLEKLIRVYQVRNDLRGEGYCLSRLGLLDLVKGNLNQAREAFQRCKRIGERLGDTGAIQSALHNLSLVQEDEGSLQESLTVLNQAIELGQKSLDKRGQCLGLKQKAKVLRKIGQTAESASLLHHAFLLAQQLGDDDIVKQILASHAALCYQMGRLKESELLNQRIKTICREEGDLAGVAGSLNHLGLLCKSQGRLQEALSYQDEAAAIYRKLGYKVALAAALGNQAETLIRMREFEKADKHNEESIRIYQDLGTMDELSIAMINKALILLGHDRLDESFRVSKDAERLARTVRSPEGIGRALVVQAQIQELRGNYTGAENLINQAIDALSQASVREGLAVAYSLRGKLLCKHLGRKKGALDDFDKSIEIAEESGFQQIVMSTLSLMIGIYGDNNDYEIALVAARELGKKAIAYGDRQEYIRASLASCDLLCRLGDCEEARSIGERALLDAQDIHNDDLYARGLFSLSIVLREQGDPKKSLEYLDKASITYKRLEKRSLVVRCMVMKAQVLTFDLQRKNEGTAMLRKTLEICDQYELAEEKKDICGIQKSIEQRMR